MSALLEVKNLHSRIAEREILKGIDLTVKAGEIHIIMGPNGAGKSTLAYTLMGHEAYEVTAGDAFLDGQELLNMRVDERAKAGLFMSFQTPEIIPGVTVENFLRTAKAAVTGQAQKVIPFKRELMKNMDLLNMDVKYASRYLNEGFSGGEKKKNEILQMLTLQPKVAILDETDSGLDVDAIKVVADGVKAFANDTNAIIVITHYDKLLSYLEPDYVHILVDGKFVKTGGAELTRVINEQGFEAFLGK